MASATDLTFDQLLTALGGNNAIFVGEDALGNITLLLSVAVVNEEPTSTTSSEGVIKFLARLLVAAKDAQDAANVNRPVGERIDAIPAATSSGEIVDGYVSQVQVLKSRIKVASASVIVAPSA